MLNNNNMEVVVLLKIANSYKTPQSLGKIISQICQKLPIVKVNVKATC